MAAIIDTSHRYVGLWGTDPYGVSMDGFTSGNYAGGVLPTQLSSDWCNAVQQEITGRMAGHRVSQTDRNPSDAD